MRIYIGVYNGVYMYLDRICIFKHVSIHRYLMVSIYNHMFVYWRVTVPPDRIQSSQTWLGARKLACPKHRQLETSLVVYHLKVYRKSLLRC